MNHFVENISIEEICGKKYRVRLVEASENGKAAFTHYIHNSKNSLKQKFKGSAINHVKHALEYKFPNREITNQVAEQALQKLLFELDVENDFSPPETPKFSFIDLFAGIGGFRIAMQNLGGKCIFSSEWDEYSKKTYHANFGEVPFGE